MKTVGSIHLIPKRKKQFLFLEVENSFDGDVLIRKERCTAKRQRRLRMASDPDIAKKIENDITGIPAAHEQMFAKAKIWNNLLNNAIETCEKLEKKRNTKNLNGKACTRKNGQYAGSLKKRKPAGNMI